MFATKYNTEFLTPKLSCLHGATQRVPLSTSWPVSLAFTEALSWGRSRSQASTEEGNGPSAEEVAKAIELCERGSSTAAIGRRLGFRGETIRQRLLGSGANLRRPHDWRTGAAHLATG